MSEVKLNLKGWGFARAEIVWVEFPLYKIKFIIDDNIEEKTEIFHANEIINFNEIFIDENLNISKYEDE